VGFEGIINLCPLRALCQKAFPASLNFSPEVYSVIIYKTMAKCYVCGKTSKVGRSVTFSGERNPRLFKANLHRVKAVLEDGTVKRIYVCTKCLKAGKVVKAVKFS
jgi:large subunit ribosomal protein L28